MAETGGASYMLEPRRRKDMEDSIVLAKEAVAVKWCPQATDYALQHDGKEWHYALIPRDVIS